MINEQPLHWRTSTVNSGKARVYEVRRGSLLNLDC
jgi:hypothetical protein